MGRIKARRPQILLAASAWSLWVWTTRVLLTMNDDGKSTGFKVVHVFLAGVSIAFALAIGWIGWRLHRESKD